MKSGIPRPNGSIAGIGAQTFVGQQIQHVNNDIFVGDILVLRFDADNYAFDFFGRGDLGFDAAQAVEQFGQGRIVGDIDRKRLQGALDRVARAEHNRGDFASTEIPEDERFEQVIDLLGAE